VRDLRVVDGVAAGIPQVMHEPSRKIVRPSWSVGTITTISHADSSLPLIVEGSVVVEVMPVGDRKLRARSLRERVAEVGTRRKSLASSALVWLEIGIGEALDSIVPSKQEIRLEGVCGAGGGAETFLGTACVRSCGRRRDGVRRRAQCRNDTRRRSARSRPARVSAGSATSTPAPRPR